MASLFAIVVVKYQERSLFRVQRTNCILHPPSPPVRTPLPSTAHYSFLFFLQPNLHIISSTPIHERAQPPSPVRNCVEILRHLRHEAGHSKVLPHDHNIQYDSTSIRRNFNIEAGRIKIHNTALASLQESAGAVQKP